MRFRVLVALLAAPSLALGAPKKKPAAPAPAGSEDAAAKPPPSTKTPSPCGVKLLPIAVGNTWTYAMVPAPAPPDDSIKRISPAQFDSITISVKSIDAPKGGDTVITLEEKTSTDLTKDRSDPKAKKIDEHTYTSTITCNAKKFEISPESFFFSGEPGGYIGLKLDSIERPKGTSWQLTNGGIGDQQWREDVHMKWTRTPTEGSEAKLGTGRIELERQFTPQQPEAVSTRVGAYTAEKLGLLTTGRVFLDGVAADAKPMELPANWISTLWIAPGTGVVQTLDPYAHMYQLTDATLK
ncbi:MAG TPA: hypothetical protein VH143_02960 [Kofleriaceae bacterium]|nr:hypothetical protein [Kofleriaceae bacterium]